MIYGQLYILLYVLVQCYQYFTINIFFYSIAVLMRLKGYLVNV